MPSRRKDELHFQEELLNEAQAAVVLGIAFKNGEPLNRKELMKVLWESNLFPRDFRAAETTKVGSNDDKAGTTEGLFHPSDIQELLDDSGKGHVRVPRSSDGENWTVDEQPKTYKSYEDVVNAHAIQGDESWTAEDYVEPRGEEPVNKSYGLANHAPDAPDKVWEGHEWTPKAGGDES